MIKAIQESLMSHLWHLSDELNIFVFFDDHIDITERYAMLIQLTVLVS